MKKEYYLYPGGKYDFQSPILSIVGERPKYKPYIRISAENEQVYVGSLDGLTLTNFMKSLCKALGYKAVKLQGGQ